MLPVRLDLTACKATSFLINAKQEHSVTVWAKILVRPALTQLKDTGHLLDPLTAVDINVSQDTTVLKIPFNLTRLPVKQELIATQLELENSQTARPVQSVIIVRLELANLFHAEMVITAIKQVSHFLKIASLVPSQTLITEVLHVKHVLLVKHAHTTGFLSLISYVHLDFCALEGRVKHQAMT